MILDIQTEITEVSNKVGVKRDAFVGYMFKALSKPYLRFFRKNRQAWGISKADLLSYDKHTLGYKIGSFLERNNFEIEAKMEEHDVFHVLSNTPTDVLNEVCLQYYMFGNGKRSIFLYIVLATGIILYTRQFQLFWTSYQSGKASLPFHQLDFKQHLNDTYHQLIFQYQIKQIK